MDQQDVVTLMAVIRLLVRTLSERALAFIALLLTFVVFVAAGIGETNWIRYGLAATWSATVFIPVVMLVFRRHKPQISAEVVKTE